MYVITPDDLPMDEVLHKTKIITSSGARIVQFRNKNLSSEDKYAFAIKIKDICHENNAILIINDDANLAYKIQADGLHLGQEDMSCIKARKLLGKEYIIGISCHNDLQLSLKAIQESADYIAIGSIFKSKTKPLALKVSIEEMNYICKNINKPVIAIGGINNKNIHQIQNSLAKMAAISKALYQSQKTKEITECLIKKI